MDNSRCAVRYWEIICFVAKPRNKFSDSAFTAQSELSELHQWVQLGDRLHEPCELSGLWMLRFCCNSSLILCLVHGKNCWQFVFVTEWKHGKTLFPHKTMEFLLDWMQSLLMVQNRLFSLKHIATQLYHSDQNWFSFLFCLEILTQKWNCKSGQSVEMSSFYSVKKKKQNCHSEEVFLIMCKHGQSGKASLI